MNWITGIQRALDYVEAHGVQAQGVFVSGRPADLAALCGEVGA